MDTPAGLSVPRTHGRIQWLALSSTLCVIVGFWLLRGTSAGAGWFSIVLGGLCALWAIRRLRDKRPGLVIAADGLTDRSNVTSVGFVPWSDITRVQAMLVNKQPMLLIHVRDPEAYIARGSAMQRTLRQANWRASGTPIVIAVHALQMRGDLLQAEIQRRLDEHRVATGGIEAGG